MYASVSVFRFALLLWALSGVLVGCGGRGTPPEVPSGEFTAYVKGSLSDTLSGTVHHRITDDGALTGLELGPEDGVGLSIDLEPHMPALRTYEVMDDELFGIVRTGQPPGALAFLTLKGAQFESVDGTFEITYVDKKRVGATFRFYLTGGFEGPAAGTRSVEVTGALNAAPE
ncbi:MAG: hypothetical protein BRD55_03645 [Bacteroidetes bacterium SW_9_63_38]|nr:MAG: hypothetical protein BRD55_03645 [Bacteroidetes bacterium SW_9_63_38]